VVFVDEAAEAVAASDLMQKQPLLNATATSFRIASLRSTAGR
jgi:hypothetical protein